MAAAAQRGAFEWVKAKVLPDRQRKAKEGVGDEGGMRAHHKAFLAPWWQLSFGRPEMLSVSKPLPWFVTKCGKLTERFRYSAESVFDTFPWPQFGEAAGRRRAPEPGASPGAAAAAGGAAALDCGGLTPLGDGNASTAAAASGSGSGGSAVAIARIEAGAPVTAPGLPNPARLITPDGIRPPSLEGAP